MPDFDSVHPGPVEDFGGVLDEVDHLLGGTGVKARQAADALEELAICSRKINGPAAALAAVTGVAAGRVTEPREGPFSEFVTVCRDGGGIVLFAVILLEASLESEQCREPAAQQDREYRNAEAHVLVCGQNNMWDLGERTWGGPSQFVACLLLVAEMTQTTEGDRPRHVC